MTVVLGCQARSVRDVARWYDVCAGHDARDPYSLSKIDGWERDLGSQHLRGRAAVVAPDLGVAVVRPEVAEMVVAAGEALAADAGLRLMDIPVKLPPLGYEWAMANLAQLRRDLGGLWPGCRDELTEEIAFGLTLADDVYNLEMAARVEEQRTEANELMADLFDQVEFVISATNPDVAFPAEIKVNTRVGQQTVGVENNGALTIPANIVGNPAVSIPIGTFEGLPVGMQVIGEASRRCAALGSRSSCRARASMAAGRARGSRLRFRRVVVLVPELDLVAVGVFDVRVRRSRSTVSPAEQPASGTLDFLNRDVDIARALKGKPEVKHAAFGRSAGVATVESNDVSVAGSIQEDKALF
jgi:hypothetical protein